MGFSRALCKQPLSLFHAPEHSQADVRLCLLPQMLRCCRGNLGADKAVLFDERYVANPLVYCGTLGLMPVNLALQGKQKAGDLVVVAGGRTGRDGVHGVTFASVPLTEMSTDTSSSSVQIGNPIVEKKLVDVLLQARDRGLYSRITDCGGGGLYSAVG